MATMDTGRKEAIHSYRDDPSVPAFPDDMTLVVYDGVCGLCSGWVAFLLKRDGDRMRHRFAASQSELGRALYRHYGMDPDDPVSLLVIRDGRLFLKHHAVIDVLDGLGPGWRGTAWLGRLIPSAIAGPAYDLIARNRYRIWGKRETCMMPPRGVEARFLG